MARIQPQLLMSTPTDVDPRRPPRLTARLALTLRAIRMRMRSLFRPAQVEDDLSEELRGHLERLIEGNLAAGMSPADARVAALREFGNVAQAQEQCRDARGVGLIEDLVRDVRYGIRTLHASPGFTTVAVLSLALGIGANTAIFSLVNALMLRSVPVADPQQLVEIGRITQYGRGGSFSYPIYQRLRDGNAVFSGTLAISNSTIRTTGGAEDLPIGRFVSGNFFDVLGISPQFGRLLRTDDDRADGEPTVAVIGYGFWQRAFGGTPDAIGRSITIEAVPFTIVGVLPPAFEGLHGGRRVDFLIPFASEPRVRKQSWLDKGDFNWVSIVGRLKPDTSLATAQANLDPLFAAFLDNFAATLRDPDDQARMRSHRLTLESARAELSHLRRQFSQPVLLLMAAVTLVLLIACANVVNLLLSRGVTRQREISLRLAIGAGPGRVVRQLLTESALLGIMGGTLGLLVAAWGTPPLIATIAEGDRELFLDVAPDACVLAFTAIVSLGAALIAGAAPALRAARTTISSSIQGDARVLHISRTSTRWSRSLIAAQVALSLLLLTGASLIMASLRNLRTLDAGFDRDRVLFVGVNPAKAGYAGDRLVQYYRQLLDRVRSVPGVSTASLSFIAPVSGGGVDLPLAVEGRTGEPRAAVYVHSVVEDYFATLGTRLVLGRDFNRTDGRGSAPVAVINEALAQRYFHSESPIGRRVQLGAGAGVEIIGVVANAKYLTLREPGHPTIYVHALQNREIGALMVTVRTAGDPMAFAQAVRSAAQALATEVPVGRAETLSAQVNRSLVNERLVARLLGAFAALALLLASVGLYGVLGYAVARRTNEIGIRLALGAARRTVLWSVLRESWRMVAVGAVAGVLASLWLTRSLSSLLYGIEPTDPLIIAGAMLCLFVVALIAALLPAWRAARVDPVVALRQA
jgi:putative ABC transport system permease protein